MPAALGMNATGRPSGRRSADPQPAPRWSCWILAGGQSKRMGRDKSGIVIAGRSLLQHVRVAATATGLPVRTIRRDLIPHCGPLSGIYTGLKRARSGWCLFLTCDMPLVSPGLLQQLRRRALGSGRPVFIRTGRGFGFPLVLPVQALPQVEAVIASGWPALQAFARKVRALGWQPPRNRRHDLLNANVPDDVERLREAFARRMSTGTTDLSR